MERDLSQLRLLIPIVRLNGGELDSTPSLFFSAFLGSKRLVAGRGGQVNDDGAKESREEPDPVDQDALRRFGGVLRVLAAIGEERFFVKIDTRCMMMMILATAAATSTGCAVRSVSIYDIGL